MSALEQDRAELAALTPRNVKLRKTFVWIIVATVVLAVAWLLANKLRITDVAPTAREVGCKCRKSKVPLIYGHYELIGGNWICESGAGRDCPP